MPENNPPSGTREAVASAVRLAMARQKMSGRALADEIGMAHSNFSRRMVGEVSFSIDELALIALALNEPLSSLVEAVATPTEAATA